MSWTLTTSGAAIAKAGYGANSDLVASIATLGKWSDEVESTIATITRKDWVADYATVTTNFQQALGDLASGMIAKRIIVYDMSGYASRLEAQTILDTIHDEVVRSLAVLKQQQNKEVML